MKDAMSEHPMSENHREAAERFKIAMELYEFGEAIMRQNLRREHSHSSEAEIEKLFLAWLHRRPGAEEGDAEGRPIPWPPLIR